MKKLTITFLSLAVGMIVMSCAGGNGVQRSDPNDVIINDGYSTRSYRHNTGSVVVKNNLNGAVPLEIYLKSVPGVMVKGNGPNATVSIRGQVHSFVGSSEPLFIVNGVPVHGGFSEVYMMCPTYDIESINVLKDAASTAIYGSSAGNGVIVIKLKDQ